MSRNGHLLSPSVLTRGIGPFSPTACPSQRYYRIAVRRPETHPEPASAAGSASGTFLRTDLTEACYADPDS
ncbi:unnamed protein product [Periconia digitata]|uniref:Uncharacterized protein n=1 Tax=Periconia digitata TaxID=1303443 RepID=A0A9W4UCT4_9PLEO|nr:unnamed protein product [Periconia digitata]